MGKKKGTKIGAYLSMERGEKHPEEEKERYSFTAVRKERQQLGRNGKPGPARRFLERQEEKAKAKGKKKGKKRRLAPVRAEKGPMANRRWFVANNRGGGGHAVRRVRKKEKKETNARALRPKALPLEHDQEKGKGKKRWAHATQAGIKGTRPCWIPPS